MRWIYHFEMYTDINPREGRHYVESRDITSVFTEDEFIGLAKEKIREMTIGTKHYSNVMLTIEYVLEKYRQNTTNN